MMKIKTCKKVRATMVTVECPYCDCLNEGFLDDPRGGEYDCEGCGEHFKVSIKAKVILS